MTTISLPRAAEYWRDRFTGVAESLHAELHEDAVYFCYAHRYTALQRLTQIGLAAAVEVEFYRAGFYTRFVPGKPALLCDEIAQWAALCTVSVDGRLATIDAVAVWA